ncbi:MAG: apolipoprotein N-acyltransferase [Hyphomicrobiaceae bacterium]
MLHQPRVSDETAQPSRLPLPGLGRWQRRGLALGAGAVSVLAMAPFFLWPVLFLTLPVLVLSIDVAIATAPRRPAAHAAAIAWWFAFGYFLAGLFWIGEAFLVEPDKFAVLMPFAVTAMPAGLSLFWAAAAAAASLAWCPGLRRVLALAVTLAIAEWLRGHILTGFPWNVLGYALTSPGVMMQSAALLGIYGLTLLAVPVLSAPLVTWVDHAGRRRDERLRATLIAGLASLVPLALLAGWGWLRLAEAPAAPAVQMRLRLVQPSIPQREKWRPEHQRRNFDRHLDLTRRAPSGGIDDARGIDLVVWPEAAMPFLALDTPQALTDISDVVPRGGHLVSGLIRVEPVPLQVSGRGRRVLNSLAVLDSQGHPAATYDKTHLVPFGEYLPMQSALEAIGFEQLTRMRGGFDVGPSPRPLLRIAGLPPLAPLICYEAIFPGRVVSPGERPAALLNLTNDGWFGNTTGPRQHLHQTRVRAVEEGLPVIRSANNGISAVIDARGRIVASLGLDVIGTADASLPGVAPAPLYAQFGDAVFAGLLAALAGLLVLVPRTRRPRTDDEMSNSTTNAGYNGKI